MIGYDWSIHEGPSPFLEGTKIQVAWDSTTLGYLKGCPRLYEYSMIRQLEPKRQSSHHLIFGLEYHQALQEYDKYRSVDMDHNDAVVEVLRDLLIRTKDWDSKDQYKNRRNLVRSVIWYLDKFQHDPAKTFILHNGTPAVELSFKMELAWGPQVSGRYDLGKEDEEGNIQPYLLCGHLDRVVDFNDELFVMDRKTTKSTPSPFYFTNYSPDNQMTLYSIAARVVFATPVKGVIIDAAQIQVDASVFQRGFTYRNEQQIEEWLLDLEILLAQNERYAQTGYWPQNDKFCGTYRSEESGQIGCPFREVCSKSPNVREVHLKNDFQVREKPWNPLIPR